MRVGRWERRAEGVERVEAKMGGWVPPGGGLMRRRSVIVVAGLEAWLCAAVCVGV